MTDTDGADAVSGLGTILGIWAHPDDEAFLAGGLMARARRNGQRVVVVTATAGERGTQDAARWPPGRLGTLRRRELAASLAALDVREHHWLGWPDGACAAVDSDVAVAQLERIVGAVAPDTVVTFGTDGITGHADHCAVSSWATRVWERTGRRVRLLYATLTSDFHQEWAAVNEGLGLWMDGRCVPSTRREDLAVALECDGDLLDQKLVALRAHASQTASLVAHLGQDTFRRWWRAESFVDAVACHADPPGHADAQGAPCAKTP